MFKSFYNVTRKPWISGLRTMAWFYAAFSTAAQSNPSAWTPIASLTLKESYDSDVFMQRVTSLANQGSFVTTVTPSVGVQWKPDAPIEMVLGYSPEIVRYSSTSSENYIAHHGIANFNGNLGDATWESLNNFTWTEGNNTSPTFFGPGGAPALGGVPLRDRRDSILLRDGFKLQYPIGDWFVRPVGSAFDQDFRTVQRPNPAAPAGAVYQNYASRTDFNGGMDAGYGIFNQTYLTVGYRFGFQDQDHVLDSPIKYDNTYNRVLFGAEGKPLDWLKFNLAVGPDFRSFGDHTAAGFQRQRTHVYADFAASAAFSSQDSLTLGAKRFILPGYGGKSVFDDSIYELNWKHKLGSKLATSLGGKIENWDFFSSPARNEWWYGASISAAYAFNSHWSTELAYSYDRIDSETPDSTGREARRSIASLALKWVY